MVELLRSFSLTRFSLKKGHRPFKQSLDPFFHPVVNLKNYAQVFPLSSGGSEFSLSSPPGAMCMFPDENSG